MMKNFCYRRLALAPVSLLVATANAQANFVPIAGAIPQDVRGVRLPAFCDGRSKKVVSTLVTIEPSTDGNVSVLSTPANLVTAGTLSQDGTNYLTMRFNEDVARSATEGGVRVRIPPMQLEKIDACCSSRAQILPGFAALSEIVASTSSDLKVEIGGGGANTNNSTTTTTTAPPVRLDKVTVSTSAKVAIDYETGTVGRVECSTSSRLDLIAATVESVDLSTSGSASIELEEGRDTFPSGSVSTSAQVKINVNGACNNLDQSTSGSCSDGQELDLDVDVGDTYTRTGQESCTTTNSGAVRAVRFFGGSRRDVFLLASSSSVVGVAAAWVLASVL